MEHTKEIKKINLVFLACILLSVVIPFLPLNFLNERPVLQIIFSQTILVLPTVVYLAVNKLSYKETVGLKKMKLGDMAFCVLFAITIQPLMALINALSMVFAKNTTGLFILQLTEKVSFLPALFLMAFIKIAKNKMTGKFDAILISEMKMVFLKIRYISGVFVA